MNGLITTEHVQKKIFSLPGKPPAMLDRDLAELYGTSTKRINEAVKRNPDRFPDDFVFRLTKSEMKEILRSQNATANHNMSRTLPFAFSREGANMLATVSKTKIAAERSIQIIRAFSSVERAIERGVVAPNYDELKDEIVTELYEKIMGQNFPDLLKPHSDPGTGQTIIGWRGIAECLDVSVKTAQRYYAQGMPVGRTPSRKPVIDTGRVSAWLVGNVAQSSADLPDKSPERKPVAMIPAPVPEVEPGKDVGLKHSLRTVYDYLWRNRDANAEVVVSLSVIAVACEIDRSYTAKLIKKLEGKGLVVKKNRTYGGKRIVNRYKIIT